MPGMLRLVAPFCFFISLFLFNGCTSDHGSSYSATIAEGRRAVEEVMTESGATSVSVALVDGDRVIWSEAFGKADKGAGRAATTNTLYAICSASKMFAAVAVMMLVDQGDVTLDEPIAAYIKNLNMPLDARYKDITVRMLLNHSSGLPGNDARGAITSKPFPGYFAQMMDGLKYQRLKHPPGLLAAYNNDGFTMVENLVKAVTGENYQDFVHRRILAPLGMNVSRYQTAPLPADSYAKAYSNDTALGLLTLNVYGSGGLYSTPEEASRLLMMLINKGVYANSRILQEKSIAAMGADQTLGSFNPVPNESLRYGLGWDTIVQPGLAAVGVTAWQKTGDLNGYYGANIIMLPEEKLGVAVFGASNRFSSGDAIKISERILLRALVERGRIPAMPKPLSSSPLPPATVAPEDKNKFPGYYGSPNNIYRISFSDTDNSISVHAFDGTAWQPKYSNFKLRSDGWYAADDDPVKALLTLTGAGQKYLAYREKSGAGHYSVTSLIGQQLSARPAMSAIWQTRQSEIWLPVNDDSYMQFPENATSPRFAFETITGLTGYLMGKSILREMPLPADNRLDGMFLILPLGGRDMQDAGIEIWNTQEWLRHGSYLYRPLSGVPLLAAGFTTVTIVSYGFAEWRQLPPAGTLSINGTTAWLLYDGEFNQLADGGTSGAQVLSGAGTKYLLLYGTNAATISLNLTIP